MTGAGGRLPHGNKTTTVVRAQQGAVAMSVPVPQPLRVAVLGGGVAGCSLVHRLAQLSAAEGPIAARGVEISLFEMGRGPGGRAATRMTRELPGMHCDHGAPYFEPKSERFLGITRTLVEKGWVGEFEGTCGSLSGPSSSCWDFQADDEGARRLYRGIPGMSGLCQGLLDGIPEPTLQRKFSTMITGMERLDDGWKLFAKDNSCLGEFDWLAVSGSGVAHPRWSKAFGGPPPLVTAAEGAADPELSASLEAVAMVSSKPVTAALMAFDGAAAKEWEALPWRLAVFKEDPVLSKVMVRPQGGDTGLVTVVVHSTHAFSEGVADVYGATSTAARVGGAGSSSAREGDVVGQMLEVLKARLVPKWISEEAFGSTAWGPHLHRWGNAFSSGELVPATKAAVPSARIVFCGDYVAAAGADSAEPLEMALLSGLQAADAIGDAV